MQAGKEIPNDASQPSNKHTLCDAPIGVFIQALATRTRFLLLHNLLLFYLFFCSHLTSLPSTASQPERPCPPWLCISFGLFRVVAILVVVGGLVRLGKMATRFCKWRYCEITASRCMHVCC